MLQQHQKRFSILKNKNVSRKVIRGSKAEESYDAESGVDKPGREKLPRKADTRASRSFRLLSRMLLTQKATGSYAWKLDTLCGSFNQHDGNLTRSEDFWYN
ncbi:hypothetical protein Trydic_g7667 [Trypoxylus dichotomus]